MEEGPTGKLQPPARKPAYVGHPGASFLMEQLENPPSTLVLSILKIKKSNAKFSKRIRLTIQPRRTYSFAEASGLPECRNTDAGHPAA
jgi:hypothetical protein